MPEDPTKEAEAQVRRFRELLVGACQYEATRPDTIDNIARGLVAALDALKERTP
jgi:hypothetical protein